MEQWNVTCAQGYIFKIIFSFYLFDTTLLKIFINCLASNIVHYSNRDHNFNNSFLLYLTKSIFGGLLKYNVRSYVIGLVLYLDKNNAI